MDKRNELIEFALRVLHILERDKEWDADTVENISDQAMRLKLAHVDPDTALFTKEKSLLA